MKEFRYFLCVLSLLLPAGVTAFPGTGRKYQPPAAPSTGYFVLTTARKGNFGGITGADSLCLSDLTSGTWMGKAGATLDSAHVKSFLCDNSSCNSLQANTTYKFAKVGDAATGGATFTTDSSGRGPGNSNAWSGATYFNLTAGTIFWTGGRGTSSTTLWSNSPNGVSCTNWSIGTGGGNGSTGEADATDDLRWRSTVSLNTACNTTLSFICFVNP